MCDQWTYDPREGHSQDPYSPQPLRAKCRRPATYEAHVATYAYGRVRPLSAERLLLCGPAALVLSRMRQIPADAQLAPRAGETYTLVTVRPLKRKAG